MDFMHEFNEQYRNISIPLRTLDKDLNNVHTWSEGDIVMLTFGRTKDFLYPYYFNGEYVEEIFKVPIGVEYYAPSADADLVGFSTIKASSFHFYCSNYGGMEHLIKQIKEGKDVITIDDGSNFIPVTEYLKNILLNNNDDEVVGFVLEVDEYLDDEDISILYFPIFT